MTKSFVPIPDTPPMIIAIYQIHIKSTYTQWRLDGTHSPTYSKR